MKPNPNGSNQHTSDPREQECWDNYVRSITAGGKGKAMQSALNAGYSKDHARNIKLQEWFKTRLKRLRKGERLSRAEKNLEEVQCLGIYNDEGKIEKDILRVRTDVDKFIAKTHDKETYTEKQELEHSGDIKVNIVNYGDNSEAEEGNTK